MTQTVTYKHEIFGKVNLVKKFYNTFIEYQYQYKNSDSQRITNWQSGLSKLKQSLHTKALLLPTSIQKVQGFFGQSKLKIIFEEYVYVVEKQKNNRIKLNQKFTEAQLWFILFQLIEASKQMQDKHLNLNFVNQNTVLFNQYGYIKVLCQYSIPNYQDVIKNLNKSVKSDLYRSPQEVIAGNNPTLNISLKKSKTQAFSIGITIIELALLKVSDNLKSYYSENRPIFLEQPLKSDLELLKSQFSPFLYNTIVSMTRMDPLKRASTGQVWAILHPYQKQIYDMCSFKADSKTSYNSLKQYLKRLKQKNLYY